VYLIPVAVAESPLSGSMSAAQAEQRGGAPFQRGTAC